MDTTTIVSLLITSGGIILIVVIALVIFIICRCSRDTSSRTIPIQSGTNETDRLVNQNTDQPTNDYSKYMTETEYFEKENIIKTNTRVELIDDITDEVCAISYEEFKPGDEIRILSCGHKYLKEQIDEWLFQTMQCPLCRNNLGTNQ